MSLSLAQREEIAALLRERRAEQDIAHAQLAQHSGKTPAEVRKILRGEPMTLLEYQLLATPLGIKMDELEQILGGRDAVVAAHSAAVAAQEEAAVETLEFEPTEDEGFSPPVELNKEHLAERIRAAMERHEVDVARVAALTEYPKATIERALEGKERELAVYNRALEVLLAPKLPEPEPRAQHIPSARRVISEPDALTNRERKRLGKELRATIKTRGLTVDVLAEHLEHPHEWLQGLLQGQGGTKEDYEEAHEVLEDLLAEPIVDKPGEASFEVLATRLNNALGSRTKSGLARDLGISPGALNYILQGRSKNLDRYQVVGAELGLPEAWVAVSWRAPEAAPPAPPKPKKSSKKPKKPKTSSKKAPAAPAPVVDAKARGEELREKVAGSTWSQARFAEHLGKSRSWLMRLFRGDITDLAAYEDAHARFDAAAASAPAAEPEPEPEDLVARGATLRAQLDASGRTQSEIARQLGHSQSWISNALQGKTRNPETYELISRTIDEMGARVVPQHDAEALKQRLQKVGGTQAALATRVGKQQSWVSRLLRGKREDPQGLALIDQALTAWEAEAPSPAPVEVVAETPEPVVVEVPAAVVAVPVEADALLGRLDALANALDALTELLAEAPNTSVASKARIVSMERTAQGQVLGFRADGQVFVVEAEGVYRARDFQLPTGPVPASWPSRDISRS